MKTTHQHQVLTLIARSELNLETLETRHSDGLDFTDQAVWQIKKALELAYAAGEEAARSAAKSKSRKGGR